MTEALKKTTDNVTDMDKAVQRLRASKESYLSGAREAGKKWAMCNASYEALEKLVHLNFDAIAEPLAEQVRSALKWEYFWGDDTSILPSDEYVTAFIEGAESVFNATEKGLGKSRMGLTKIEGYPDRDDISPGMAHFSGTGPPGATCGQCRHYGLKDRGFERMCTEYRRMAGKWGGNLDRHQSACKYFETKAQRGEAPK